MNDVMLFLLLIGLIIVLTIYVIRSRRSRKREYEAWLFTPEGQEHVRKMQEPVTIEDLNKVLMLMQIAGAITPLERNQIFIKTSPFTKR